MVVTFVTPSSGGIFYFWAKAIIMVSNWVSYLIIFVIIAHFVAGFAFLVKKLSGPVREEAEEGQTEGSDRN